MLLCVPAAWAQQAATDRPGQPAAPRDTDNTGFISRLAPDGRILVLKWIEGGVKGVVLNAPKGSTIVDDVLYVADIDHLRRFSARTGAPMGSVLVPGATFLNDVTSDRLGNVYVTDIGFTTVPAFGPSGTDAVHKLSRNGTLSMVVTGNALLNHPNGLLIPELPDPGTGAAW